MFGQTSNLLYTTPPAIVQEAFDEQALKREWDEATADEQDAVERKAAILQKALKRWPMVPSLGGRMKYAPEMRRFVRDVLGMPDSTEGSMNSYARRLCRGLAKARADTNRRGIRNRQFQRAVIELHTKFKLGADPLECWNRLVKFVEENK